jgi:hypothetical protein
MDEQILQQIINSDELISNTIEENSRMLNTAFDQFSSIMSMTTVDGENLEKQIEEQGEKEAENIRGTLTQSVNQSSELSLEKLAENELLKTEGSSLSDDTVNSLINVISNVQGVLNNLNIEDLKGISETLPAIQNPEEPSGTNLIENPTINLNNDNLSTIPKVVTTESSPEINISEKINEIPTVDLDNLSQVIDDFKTLSNLNWCTDWLKCLEKIVEQASVVKDALSSIPENTKVSLGINEDELKKVDESIQKVKENITSDINLSLAKSEMIEKESSNVELPQLSTQFLNNFTELNEKISSFTEKIENNSVSQESFLNKVNEFSESTSKTIENTFTSFSESTKTILEKPTLFENPLENIESKVINKIKPELSNQINTENLGLPLQPEGLSLENIPLNLENLNKELITTTTIPNIESNLTKNIEKPEINVLPNEIEENIVESISNNETGFSSFFENFEKIISNLSSPIENITAEKFNVESQISTLMPPESSLVESQISTLENKIKENIPLNLENLSNFADNTFLQDEMGAKISELKEPLNLEQLGANASNILPNVSNILQIQPNDLLNKSEIDLSSIMNILPGEKNMATPPIESASLPNLEQIKPSLEIKPFEQTVMNFGPEPVAESTQNLSANMQEMIIQSQETPGLNMPTALSRIQNELPEATSKIAANTEVMMNEVNLEPLGNQLTSSISSLGENISNSRSNKEIQVSSQNNESNTKIMDDILNMLTQLNTTLQTLSKPQNNASNIPNFGSSLSDSQARMIGRQIANELKDSFSRLYN